MFTMIPYRRNLSTRPVHMFSPLLNDPFYRSFFQTPENNSIFRVDIREMDKAYQIQAELPGLEPEQISLTIEDGVLNIAADYQMQTTKEESGSYYSERHTGRMQRSFSLDNIEVDKVEANYKNGMLYVTLPKEQPTENQVRQVPIQVEKPMESEG